MYLVIFYPNFGTHLSTFTDLTYTTKPSSFHQFIFASLVHFLFGNVVNIQYVWLENVLSICSYSNNFKNHSYKLLKDKINLAFVQILMKWLYNDILEKHSALS